MALQLPDQPNCMIQWYGFYGYYGYYGFYGYYGIGEAFRVVGMVCWKHLGQIYGPI